MPRRPAVLATILLVPLTLALGACGSSGSSAKPAHQPTKHYAVVYVDGTHNYTKTYVPAKHRSSSGDNFEWFIYFLANGDPAPSGRLTPGGSWRSTPTPPNAPSRSGSSGGGSGTGASGSGAGSASGSGSGANSGSNPGSGSAALQPTDKVVEVDPKGEPTQTEVDAASVPPNEVTDENTTAGEAATEASSEEAAAADTSGDNSGDNSGGDSGGDSGSSGGDSGSGDSGGGGDGGGGGE